MSLSWNDIELGTEVGEKHARDYESSSRLNLEYGPPDAWGFICTTCRGFVPLCYNSGPVWAKKPRPDIPGPVALVCPTCRSGDLFAPADLCLGRTPTKIDPMPLE